MKSNLFLRIRSGLKLFQSTRFIAQAAMIAALYAALTLALTFSSYGLIQFRVSEVLTVLPYFTPAAIPGLFIGCILGNLASPFGIIDIICGSAASLFAAILSRKMPKKWLVPLPPILMNAVIVGLELHFYAIWQNVTDIEQYGLPFIMLMVAAGEVAVCYGLGFPLLLLLDRIKAKKTIFRI